MGQVPFQGPCWGAWSSHCLHSPDMLSSPAYNMWSAVPISLIYLQSSRQRVHWHVQNNPYKIVTGDQSRAFCKHFQSVWTPKPADFNTTKTTIQLEKFPFREQLYVNEKPTGKRREAIQATEYQNVVPSFLSFPIHQLARLALLTCPFYP